MEVEPFTNPWMKKIGLLTNLLIVSVACNIGLVIFLIYAEKNKMVEGKPKVASEVLVLKESNSAVLDRYFRLSFDDLVKELSDTTLLEDGYNKRDIALACLVNFHYFNLERAVSGKLLQRRKLTFIHQEGGESFQVEAFPGLSDAQFSMIVSYIQRETWPFTAEGLFLELKKMGAGRPETLMSAFFSSPEFCALYTLLFRFDEGLSKEKLLALLLEGEWKTIHDFIRQRGQEGGMGIESVRKFFLEFTQIGSKLAIKEWIQFDSDYLERNMSDAQLVACIDLMQENDLATNIFLKKLLCSVRSDVVRKGSALKLYTFEGSAPPEPYRHEEALRHFLPTVFAKESGQQEPISSKKGSGLRKHLVQDGESLWKIAKKYKISTKSIIECNHLKNDKINPGQELLIPNNSLGEVDAAGVKRVAF